MPNLGGVEGRKKGLLGRAAIVTRDVLIAAAVVVVFVVCWLREKREAKKPCS